MAFLADIDDSSNGRRQIETPREQPNQVQGPVECPGKLVVVARIPSSKKSEEVFVDKVEPEETVTALSPGIA